MPRNISVAEAAKRLSAAGFTHSDRYASGTAGKGGEWERGAREGADNYITGVQKALSAGSYEKGISRVGGGRYDEGVRTKGVNNWSPGMQLAEGRYQEGVAPYANLWDQSLPTPRGAKGSPENLKRMQENVKRFQDTKK